MGMNYEYDEDAASHADDFANRIDENALYIGQFTRADAVVTSKGTKGIALEFEVPGGGKTSFTLYTEKEDGQRIFGFNKVQAMMTILGLKGLRAQPGKVMGWDEGKKVEMDGEVYPDLCGKDIGVAVQKELYTKTDGKDGYRMELVSVFHPTTKLTASEIRERKVKPEKLARIEKGLKTRDNRTAKMADPDQPAIGVPEGVY